MMTTHQLKVKCLYSIEINAPHWYARQDWCDYLNGRRDCRPATWHVPDKPANEFSDVFFVYDVGEGSDAHAIPRDIWAEIDATVRAQGLDFAIVRITNLRE